MDIQDQCAAKALDQRNRTRVGLSFCIVSFTTKAMSDLCKRNPLRICEP